MVLCMHYAATAVIEAHGPRPGREAIAAGRHLSTLAFSEAGSRSHFWTPVSTATAVPGAGRVRLDARKSWATSAGEADSYVWSSRPLAAEGASTLWLVPGDATGPTAPFVNGGARMDPTLLQMSGQEEQRLLQLVRSLGQFDVVFPLLQTLASARLRSCASGSASSRARAAAVISPGRT